jgi:hypothetical protein
LLRALCSREKDWQITRAGRATMTARLDYTPLFLPSDLPLPLMPEETSIVNKDSPGKGWLKSLTNIKFIRVNSSVTVERLSSPCLISWMHVHSFMDFKSNPLLSSNDTCGGPL